MENAIATPLLASSILMETEPVAGTPTLIRILFGNRRQGSVFLCTIQVAWFDQIMALRSGPLLAIDGEAVHRGIDKGTPSLTRTSANEIISYRPKLGEQYGSIPGLRLSAIWSLLV